MYPKNAASPPIVPIGAVVQISDGAVQTSGCTVSIRTNDDAETSGGGSVAYSTGGVVLYTPTQAETNHTWFFVTAYKSGCIPVGVLVVPTNSATPGTVDVQTIEGSDATDQINAACDTACSDQLVAINLDHLCKTATAAADMTAEVADNTILSRILANGDTSAFDPATDGLQLIRDKLPTNLEDLSITDTTGIVKADVTTWLTAAPLGLSSQQVQAVVPTTQKVDVETIKTRAVTDVGLGNTVYLGTSAWSTLTQTQVTGGAYTIQSASCVLGDARIANLDATVSSRGTSTLTTGDVDTRLAAIGLDHLLSTSVAGADVADNSVVARLASKAATADWDTFNNTTDSLEALRDRGDAAWSTATGFSTHSAADVVTALGTGTTLTALATASALDVVDNFVDTEVAAIKAVTDKLDTTLVQDGAVYDFTAAALAAAPSGGLSAQEVRDAMKLGPSGGDPQAGSVDKHLDDILADTNELQTDWADGGRLDTILDTAAGSSGGSGARTVSATVTDGTDPLESARVRMTKGAESYILSTNASGQCTFNLDDGSWTVAISLAGYTFSGATLVVDGNETPTYAMTQTVFPTSGADQVTGYLYCYDEEGDPEEDVTVSVTAARVTGLSGIALDSAAYTETSDANGLVQFTGLVKGASYYLRRGTGPQAVFTVPATADDPVALAALIGTP